MTEIEKPKSAELRITRPMLYVSQVVTGIGGVILGATFGTFFGGIAFLALFILLLTQQRRFARGLGSR